MRKLPGHGGKLPSLDTGRFVAALLVTMFHATFTVINFGSPAPFDGIMRGGHSGVEYFFVLSGFIIFYAHRNDLSNPQLLMIYWRKRATRILPMLWLVLVPWGLFRIVFAGDTTNAPTGFSTLILDMLLLPHAGPLVLGVTWTLQRELIFYVLFGVLFLSRRLGIFTIILWQASIVASTILDLPLGPWGSAVLDVANLGFGLGLVIGLSFDYLRFSRPSLLTFSGSILFLTFVIVEYRLGGPLEPDYRPLSLPTSVLLYTLAAGIGILGLVAYDRRSGGRGSPILRALGGSSYVLYLVHGPIGSVLVRILKPLNLSAEILFVLLTLVPVVAALVIHIRIERPILRTLRPVEKRSPDTIDQAAHSQLS